jgi:hypothetical protein
MRSLIWKNPSSKPLQEACSGFAIAACDSKKGSESHLRSSKLFQKLAMNVHWRKSTIVWEGKPEQKLMWLSEFRTSKSFQKTSINLIFFFLLTRQAKNLKTFLCSGMFWYNLIGLKKYPYVDPIPLKSICYYQCCGSGMFIPDQNFSIQDPGSEFSPSRIPDPHQRI